MLRAPEAADAATVAAFTNEHWPESFTTDRVRRSWKSPRVDVQRDARIEAGAYACVEALGGGRAWIELQGRPSAELLDWAERRAMEEGTRLFSGAWTTNEPILEELQRRGYRAARFSDRMRVDLDGQSVDPVWPAGFELRTFREGDERAFYDIQQETFADMWERVEETFDEWIHSYVDAPSFDPTLWFLACESGVAVGAAMCQLRDPDTGLGWVDVLGVRAPWRRRGVARALLLSAFAEFRKRGLRQAGLGVDGDPAGEALRLYESVGMERVARYEIRAKEIA